ncbi:MAG: DUF3048 domain-containing protein [Clostridiales Family XIII bacterium]|jgi:hypothetical protein|nr:DUF3048 domain-containing protein [Clostridiales Family XIII bacterium]
MRNRKENVIARHPRRLSALRPGGKGSRIAKLSCLFLLAAVLSIMPGCGSKASSGGEDGEAPAPIVPAPPEETFFFPYTGEETGDPFKVKNVPLSVKIENSAAARPQMGLNRTDVVYETMVEGGETRFNCIFQSQIPEEVGPVRSARLSDLWIVPQYQGLFFYSGGNTDVVQKIRASDIADMSHSVASAIFRRVDFRSAPHNLYLRLDKGYETAQLKGFGTRSDSLAPLNHGSVDAAPTASAGAITLNFGGSDIRWDWDAERGVYLRSQSGKALTDAVDDQQVFTVNVAVLYADYAQQAMLDPAGSPTYDTTLGGTGKAILFRDGRQYECAWKADRHTPPSLTNAAGETIPLKPGRTWFEVLPPRGSIRTE